MSGPIETGRLMADALKGMDRAHEEFMADLRGAEKVFAWRNGPMGEAIAADRAGFSKLFTAAREATTASGGPTRMSPEETDHWAAIMRRAIETITSLAERSQQSATDREVRVTCLRIAADVAKLGLAHDVLNTACRYERFVIDGTVEDEASAGLTPEQRIQGLVDELLRSTEGDGRLLKSAIASCYARLDNAYPDLPQNVGVPSADYLDGLDPSERIPR